MKTEPAGSVVKSVESSVVKRYRKSPKRNFYRRLRRKRSKLRYYYQLKEVRYNRKTDDLCSAVTVVDITDMEWSPYVTATSTEVSEWHKQEQIAYWKSKALSLEYENRMLLQHIRNVYAKQTEDYANYAKEQILIEDSPKSPTAIVEPAGRRRREEMEKLYGKKAAKILGMETAVQLNYDLKLEEAGGKPPYWPHTPLNLKFD